MFATILRGSAAYILTCLLWTGIVQADVFQLGHLRLSSAPGDGFYVLSATIPVSSFSGAGITLPQGCELKETKRADRSQSIRIFYNFYCSEPLQGTIRTPWRLDGARFVNDVSSQPKHIHNLIPGPAGIDIPLSNQSASLQTLSTLAITYLYEGIEHIWFGWDHLLFILCLCFLMRGRQLIAIITAFTLGHSLTLGLSYFNVLSVAVAPVESLIAFSIILMARQSLMAKGKQDLYWNWRIIFIIGAFGLLHGLGFASALAELSAAETQKWPTLIFFNLGVEVGQILFVMVFTVFQKVINLGKHYQRVRNGILMFTGCIAGYWFVERLVTITAL
ncbi:HupE/UreJ family protein [Thalassotalea litorea]|uniref:HupE/UreJ family protein n=1 Tax=Thalassotalea litorea TaxID=2020715 RepID=A0A5R9IE51_9GAMM|nr:HupE/UreJ family protein [Thalassotalea litorea]TLU61875.1 HupE/UreJ family protein [Thalassotalea litorea]